MEIAHHVRKGADLHGSVIRAVAANRELSSTDMLPGDLIFRYSGDQLFHVSIVTATHASGAVDHAHLLNDALRIGLHEGAVTTASNLVVRCRNPMLSKMAASNAHRWTELAMPYSNFRRRLATVHADKEQAHLVASHRELFNRIGKFRAIKYAARRNGDLIYPSEKDPRIEGNRGMFCSMFVAVCYQVAGLESLVASAPDGIRVSDKSTALRDLSKGDWKDIRKVSSIPKEDVLNFQAYLACLKDIDPYVLFSGTKEVQLVEDAARKAPAPEKPRWRLRGSDYSPSLAFWRGPAPVSTCDWPQHITKGMMVDAKVIMPEGLLLCLLDDVGETGGWEVMGMLRAVKVFSVAKDVGSKRQIAQQEHTDKRFPRKS